MTHTTTGPPVTTVEYEAAGKTLQEMRMAGHGFVVEASSVDQDRPTDSVTGRSYLLKVLRFDSQSAAEAFAAEFEPNHTADVWFIDLPKLNHELWATSVMVTARLAPCVR